MSAHMDIALKLLDKYRNAKFDNIRKQGGAITKKLYALEQECAEIYGEIIDSDVVEVVRCKDCKYWQPHTQCGFDEDNDEYHNYCGYHMPDDEWYAEYWEADGYCSYGERKKQKHERVL